MNKLHMISIIHSSYVKFVMYDDNPMLNVHNCKDN
jgi:hypothetical protein